MFKNKEEKQVKNSTEAMNSNNIIGKGSTFKGNVETYGNIRVEGKIIGDLTSKSKVAIGPSAMIDGNVLAQVAEVEGEVKGSLEVTELLILKPNCKITGDIITNKLVVESGAKFDGKCKMGD
ncbi:polymer-forming cytoskeletal protein, partial [Fulvivirga sp. RKSG066]|uniref:bactofilin family protein n=1 Tax=Fulvivirga aurantia TaxID=2529383 RepID=UPI0012BD7C06